MISHWLLRGGDRLGGTFRLRSVSTVRLTVLSLVVALLPLAAPLAGGASAQTGAVVVTAAPTQYGPVLFTADGRALYVRSADAATAAIPAFVCSGPCATAWPPLLAPTATGPFAVGGGVKEGDLSTIQLPDGTYQVTYFGHPLYEFIRDTSPGATNGENVTAFFAIWDLVTLTGHPAPGQATVILETAPQGSVLAASTAFGTHRSLYLLTFDPPNATTCTGVCTGIWPPLLTDRQAAAGPGVNPSGLDILERPDGTRQVTYFGHPVYLFAFDLGPDGQPSGLTNGEYFVDQFQHGIWYLLSPSGLPNPGPLSIASMSSSLGTILAVNPPSPFASRPFAVYAFSADTATASACAGTCARFWPPVLVGSSSQLTAAAGSGVNQAGLGTITRSDGTLQVTYFGHPLYFFAFGQPGQTNGQGITAFGGTFQVVSLAGTPLT